MDTDKAYRIGDLARRFGITTRTLRYYEELGLLQAGNRQQGQGLAHRCYDEKNVIRLKRIQQLKDYGLTLAEIHELFELARKDRSGRAAKLTEARRRRDLLDHYIDELAWHLEQLDKVDDFFACPGQACETCGWAERCDMHSLLPRPDVAAAGRPAQAGSPAQTGS